ncbi:putative GPI-anchored protein pfl2 [Ostrinia furnacalis]|uniref:putative GPI-anchored protein pfl2 n=1 Tax=Ostrinia furnacalis TaxID=93504 RepID=UPI00103C076C|nr:putative GPI-anchored protein pfl2 [Ostrinia furnacalis]XP_028163002.1 putative GPI-anchored protein pfl2 [Ostrinia furnacalis]
MRWKTRGFEANMITRAILLVGILAINVCDGARRPAQRRKDTSRSAELYEPAPSAESLQVIAQAMGAAGFEHYTEGRALVKRLIPADSQPDLDVVEHQGVIGKAGVDFPAYPNIPATGFNCKNVPTGYYADLETDCQVFHICDTSRKISFLCPNGTIFSQSHLICDWWFKVDCASAPALYESSAEYYSNEQKKTQKITQSLTKNPDLQQIGTDTNVRAESRRASVNVPSTTERLLRHRQRLQGDALINSKATARSFQALFDTTNFNPTQRTQATTAIEKRRKNLVQLITNNFGNFPSRSTSSSFTEGPVYRPTTAAPAIDYNSIREMQVAAETASFAANNNNRQFLQDYNNKNYRPYPVYTPNVPVKSNKPKTNHHLTTLYDFRDKNLEQVSEKASESTTKRSTLVPYNKPYTTPNQERRDPYTRPGISLLKDFLEKEKNKTIATSTEKISQATDRSDQYDRNDYHNKVTIETKDTYESATKIPQTTRSLNLYASDTASSDRQETRTTPAIQVTTEPYQERRERLIRKLNLGNYGSTTEATLSTETEKYYGDLPNRPGLVVPPSLTPKTLHSLAIYYATALDNLSTTETPDAEVTTPAFDEYEPLDEELPGLFSRHTLNKYSSLFGHGHDNSELLEDLKLDPNGTYNELAEDLSVQQSQNPLATSPQIRELAQVFTHALSAYLQDPVQFRKVLSDIRPTQPSFGEYLTTEEGYNTEPTTTVNEDDDEILGFSDDIKTRPALPSLRDPKALNILATNYPTVYDDLTTTPKPYTTEINPSSFSTVTPRSPFRCCDRISASYTTASTPISPSESTTPKQFTNTVAVKVNTLANRFSENLVSTTEDSYAVPKFGGFQNNSLDSPYGTGVSPTNSQPLNEYVEVTNLPTAWGIDASDSSAAPSISTVDNTFESKKIRTTTVFPETTPVYFTETDSVELENEEELQRAHSQSFIAPQSNSLRQGKQLQLEETSTVKKPSEDLEAPTVSEIVTTTAQPTTQASTTIKVEELDVSTTPSPVSSDVFTSPDSEKTTNQFQWSTFEAWQSTVIDPITLNDGLSPSGPEQQSQVARQTNAWALSTTAVPSTDYTGANEQTVSPTINVELTTPGTQERLEGDRFGRLLRNPTSTEPAQDLSAITDTVVEKAKEIMGGMNATTTEKLMNVMKKTKSKTVRRLILLLVQTCDDDHNTTAEASKRALLEALMAVSQKDMEEIAKEQEQGEYQTTTSDIEARSTEYRKPERFDRQEKSHVSDRRGKSLNFDPSAINSLSNPTSTETVRTTTEVVETTTVPVKTTFASRRGTKRFHSRTTAAEAKVTTALPYVDSPKAEARTAEQSVDSKGTSDTRALELLRSLYTIAARWG